MSVRSSIVTRTATALLVVLFVVALVPSASAKPDQNDLRQAQDRLAALEDDLALALLRYEEARAQLAALRHEADDARKQVRAVRAQAAEGRAHVVRVVGTLYRSAGQGDLELLLSSREIAEAGRRIGYLGAIQHAHTRIVERAMVDQRTLEASLAQLRESTEAAEATEAELGRMRGELESMVAGQRLRVAGLSEALDQASIEQVAARTGALVLADSPGGAGSAAVSGSRSRTSSGTTSRSQLTPPAKSAPVARAGAGKAVQAALSQIGKPYKWGAAGPNAYDCSGLTSWAWAQAGRSLPHSSRAQYASTTRVSRDDLQPGDLLFFGSPIHHVAMYIGNGRMVEASRSGTPIRVSSINRSDYAGAGRV
jgi:peptidoglycan DL-endopeptidase CwlO